MKLDQMNSPPAYGPAHIRELLSISASALDQNPYRHSPIKSECWQGILSAALAHGLIGPLRAATCNAASISAKAHDCLLSAYVAQAVRNMQVTDALFEVLQSFRQQNIAVLVMKGPALALLAFNRIAARSFEDLDLLIRPNALEKARAALLHLGYHQTGSYNPKARGEKDITFVRDSDGVIVELHWAVTPPNLRLPIEGSGIWDRAQMLPFQDDAIPTFGLEDTFLIHAIHGCKHGWYNLKWIYDMARLVVYRGAEIDWPALLQQADGVGCTRTVFVAVRLACDLFGVAAPPALSASDLSADVVVRLAEAIRRPLLAGQMIAPRDLLAVQIQMHDRLKDRLFVAVTASVPELRALLPDIATPIKNGPIRFLTRPLRLVHLYGFSWFRSAVLGR